MLTALPHRSIASLYPLALAEGEGLGSAYEYYAKRLVLASWLASQPLPRRLLIAGLPQKYGSSLDFFLLAEDLDVGELVVVEDRPAALEKCCRSMAAAQARGELTRTRPHYLLVSELGLPDGLTGDFDICLGSEVLQRLNPIRRRQYVLSFANLAPHFAWFVPNGDNPSFKADSDLSGLSLTELRALIEPVRKPATCGYIDMPPFPPGLTRSAAQRERAANGQLEKLAMRALGLHARVEKFFPLGWRRFHSHINYALVDSPRKANHQANGD